MWCPVKEMTTFEDIFHDVEKRFFLLHSVVKRECILSKSQNNVDPVQITKVLGVKTIGQISYISHLLI